MSTVVEMSVKAEEPLPPYPRVKPSPGLPSYSSLFTNNATNRVEPSYQPGQNPSEQTIRRSDEDERCFPPNSFEKFCCK